MWVFMRTSPNKMISNNLPDDFPLGLQTIYAKLNHLHQLLQKELLRIAILCQFVARHTTELFDKRDDRVNVEVLN
jgi:hypothetical protein